MALGHGHPGARQHYRWLFRGASSLRIAEMFVRLRVVSVLECVEAEENVGNGVVGLAFHEALRKAASRVELTGREVKLESLIDDVLIGRVLGKGSPVIKHGVIVIPGGTRDVPGKIAPEQRVDLRDIGPGG